MRHIIITRTPSSVLLTGKTKIDIVKDWKDKTIFIPANDFKAKGAGKVIRVKSTSSNSSEESTWLGKARMTRSAKATYTNKDPNFYLDSAADNHMSYNRQLFKDLKPLATAKTVKVANGELVAVKGIGSITFELNVHGKKVRNTITGVKFVPELDYNLIATGVFEKKGCKITQEKGRIVIIDEDDGLTFMTGTRQPSAIGNSYTLDLWKPPTSRAKVSKTPTSWTQWHCCLGHLDNSGNENQMPSPPVPAATTPAEPPTPRRSSQNASQPQADSCLGSQGNKDSGNK